MKWLRNLAAIVAAFLKKYKAVIVGQGIYTTLSWLYDNVLWWTVEVHYGVMGVAVMMIGAVLINFSILLYYRNKKVSWLGWDQGADIVKEKEQCLRRNAVRICMSVIIVVSITMHIPEEIPWQILPVAAAVSIIAVLVALFLRFRMAEDIFALFLLSTIEDSFIATAYLRHGRTNGLEFRDFMVFLASSMISVSYWAVRNGIIVEAVIRPLVK